MSRAPARLIDVSITASADTPEWPGDTPFSCGWTWAMAAGASVNVSSVTSSPHVGTHADAPLHVRDGWLASDALPLEPFAGRATVWSVDPTKDTLTLDDLPLGHDGVPPERLLLRTSCTIADGRFPERWPALDARVAATLAARGLRLLGLDAPSVDARTSTALAVHHALFAAGAFVLENLDLRAASDGEYLLSAYPVKYRGLDAAPVRAVLAPLG